MPTIAPVDRPDLDSAGVTSLAVTVPDTWYLVRNVESKVVDGVVTKVLVMDEACTQHGKGWQGAARYGTGRTHMYMVLSCSQQSATVGGTQQ